MKKKLKNITEQKNINIGNENLVSLKDILFNYARIKKLWNSIYFYSTRI